MPSAHCEQVELVHVSQFAPYTSQPGKVKMLLMGEHNIIISLLYDQFMSMYMYYTKLLPTHLSLLKNLPLLAGAHSTQAALLSSAADAVQPKVILN